METTLQTTREQALDQVQRPENAALAYLASLQSAGSRRVMGAALGKAADLLQPGADLYTFPWGELRRYHVTALRSKLAETLSYVTVNRYLSALRGVAKEAWHLGLLDGETYRKIADVKGLSGETVPAGRDVSAGEIAALMGACAADSTATGIRDGAVIALLYAGGLRRAELAALHLADWDGAFLTVAGKGNKQRRVPVDNGAADALADWLTLRGDAPGPLFYATRRGGHVQAGKGITSQAVYNLVQKRADQAGIAELSPHDFRRTVVGDLLDAGADLATVQKLLGHADPGTTSRYDRRGDAAKRRAVRLLHVPYKRRTLRESGA